MPRPRILLTSTLRTSFLDDDLAIFRRHAEVELLIASGPLAPLRILPRLLRADLSFTWFASVYSAPIVAGMRLLRRPSLIAVGGVDAARFPEIGYGVWSSRWKGAVVGYAVRHATAVLVVDGSLKERLTEYAKYDGINIRVIPTGYDAGFWTPGQEKRSGVLTVARCDTRERFVVKGIPLLFAAASLMPDIRFTVVGISPRVALPVRRGTPSNVSFIPPVPRDALAGWYRQAAVYCQPSLSEGMPNSVCEAMLCGCVPVGTDVGGMRSVIGDAGALVPHGDPKALAQALYQALSAGEPARALARSRIAGLFPVERREAEILRLLREVAE